jgi:hypothetical protein
MPLDSIRSHKKSLRLQDIFIAIVALILMLYLTSLVADLRQTNVSAVLEFVLNSAPNLISATLAPFIFLLYVTRTELYKSSLGFGLGLILYECLQSSISWAVFDWWDLVATLVGTLLSLALIRVLPRT